MHPNPAFRSDNGALLDALIDQIGFGMVFAATPDGPRVAHTPLLRGDDGAIRFHLARGNALTAHLDNAAALVVVNGPDGYVSPRWYADRDTVPTWDYVTLEMEGRIRRLDDEGLEGMLHRLITTHEGRIPGDPWRAGECGEARWATLRRGIVGFEMEVLARRPTLKLSQKKSSAEREAIAAGLEAAGSPALAHLMRTLAA